MHVGGLFLTQLYSFQFLAFLVVALAAYYIVGRIFHRGQWIVLLVASMGFYLCSGWQNLFFILFTAVTVWLLGLAFARFDGQCKELRSAASDKAEKKAIKKQFAKRKWAVLLVGLVLNFGVLGYMKYWNTLLQGFGAGDAFTASQLLLPLGISFYTFQSVAYLIDTYNGKYDPQRNFAKFLLFVSFFPQLIQGPINRYDALAEQLYATRRLDLQMAKRGLILFGFGLMKKTAIANTLYVVVNNCLDNIDPGIPGSVVVFGILLYSAQQYADFSGGIDMVRGVSQLFGIEMAENFRQPYFSISLADFWRRWHITLGAWMRDYVFYPFALRPTMGKLGKWAGKHMGKHMGRTLPACLANILVFFLVGLWHGADAHFITWGLYNGIVIALADLCMPIFTRMNKALHINMEGRAHHWFCIIRTFIVVNIGWYFDRIYDFGNCLTAMHNTIFSFDPLLLWTWLNANPVDGFRMRLAIALIACIVVFIVSVRKEHGIDVIGSLLARRAVVRYAVYVLVFFFTVYAFIYAPASGGGFMYANF